MGNTIQTIIKRGSILAIACLNLCFVNFAQSSVAEQVNDLISKDNYQEAKVILLKQVEDKPSATAFANLALVEYALNNRGEAALAVEKAKSLGGFRGSDDLLDNIQKTLPAELKHISQSPWRKFVQSCTRSLPYNFFSFLCLVIGILLTITISLQLVQKYWIPKRYLSVFYLACFLCFFLSLSISLAEKSYRNTTVSVLIKDSFLYSAPSQSSESKRNLPEATIVTSSEELDEMIKVNLPNQESGWVPIKDLKRSNVPNL